MVIIAPNLFDHRQGSDEPVAAAARFDSGNIRIRADAHGAHVTIPAVVCNPFITHLLQKRQCGHKHEDTAVGNSLGGPHLYQRLAGAAGHDDCGAIVAREGLVNPCEGLTLVQAGSAAGVSFSHFQSSITVAGRIRKGYRQWRCQGHHLETAAWQLEPAWRRSTAPGHRQWRRPDRWRPS